MPTLPGARAARCPLLGVLCSAQAGGEFPDGFWSPITAVIWVHFLILLILWSHGKKVGCDLSGIVYPQGKKKKKRQRRLDSWITYNDFRDIYTGGFSVNGGNVCLTAVRRKPAKLRAWELHKSERSHWRRRAVVPEILFLESLCRVGKRWHLKLTKPAFKLTPKFVAPKNSLQGCFREDCELKLQVSTMPCKIVCYTPAAQPHYG